MITLFTFILSCVVQLSNCSVSAADLSTSAKDEGERHSKSKSELPIFRKEEDLSLFIADHYFQKLHLDVAEIISSYVIKFSRFNTKNYSAGTFESGMQREMKGSNGQI